MRRGFTLLELLCALAVLAVLAAVTAPSIRGIQEEARLAETRTNLAVLQSAAEAYYSKFGAYPAAGDYQDALMETGIFTRRLRDPLTQTEYFFWQNGRYYVLASPGLNRRLEISLNAAILAAGRLDKRLIGDDLLATNLRMTD
ncbi:MAG: prepilin-type N-terminal cleavage/methylation domain-containing protein [Candidatus Margulisbacteria bacterium]|jgi:prepilin-type N-terminal cleavage/methylation domain-containing protein|nr:prepilin-type N-terminal cleavage/methylation domain-containing protein [Candidatus Margulisiibacteriota bacterium]